MKPEIDRVLEQCAISLMTEMAPQLSPSYMQASAIAMGVMLVTIREELDRIAERRVEENRALRVLFAEALAGVDDANLRERVAEAAESEDTSLRISALDVSNAILRGLLIELHAHVETRQDEAARSVEAAIWRELAASTERRRLSLAPF